MELFYCRVSTADQNEARQLIKASELGIDERYIFVDKASGATFDRPEYKAMKRMLRSGDIVYVDSLDRLGRDYDGIIREWKDITRSIGADIIVLENEALFDSRKFREMGDIGRLMEDQFLALLAYVAEQERKKIRQRQAEGIAAAKANGKLVGRPSVSYMTLTKEQRDKIKTNYSLWKAGDINGVQFANTVGLRKTTFYKIVKEYEQKKGLHS